jgi:hypothetical protein
LLAQCCFWSLDFYLFYDIHPYFISPNFSFTCSVKSFIFIRGTQQIPVDLISEGTVIAAKFLKSMGINFKGDGFVAVEIKLVPVQRVW